MTTPLERSPSAEQQHSTAFGLALSIDPRISIPGVTAGADLDLDLLAPDLPAPPAPSAEGPARRDAARRRARVRLDPGALAERWSGAEQPPERVRELRDGNTVTLSTELALPAGYLLDAPGYGRILIDPDGRELLCAPEPGGADWSVLLPSQALPLAATLQGLEVLHAAGVVLHGRAILLAGAPGAGKSSLAAALLRRGAELLSDDVVALELCDGGLLAHPGAALLQLRAAEHERLSARERSELGEPEVFLDKQRYTPSVAASAAPFGELFLLERSAGGPAIEQIEAVDPFALLASTFNLSVRTPERLERQLDLVAALAATARIYRLRIQPGIDATALAEIVHERLAPA